MQSIRLSIGEESRFNTDLWNQDPVPWEDFCAWVEELPEVGPKDGAYFVRGPVNGAGKRANENIVFADIAVLDGDKKLLEGGEPEEGAPHPSLVHEVLRDADISHAIFTSWSHRPDFCRFRVIVPVHMESKRELEAVVAWLLDLLHRNNVPLAPVKENTAWAQPWFHPRLASPDSEYLHYTHDSETSLDLNAIMDWFLERSEPPSKGARSVVQGDTPWAKYNSAHGNPDAIRELLERHGYTFKGEGGPINGAPAYRFLAPESSTGNPGLRVFKGRMGDWLVSSSHGSDPINDGNAHDAWDLFVRLEHGGNGKAAKEALGHVSGERGQSADVWPEAEPLGSGFTEPMKFPDKSLPPLVRDAVLEYAAYGKEPIALIASCALAAMSLVSQGHADIARDSQLVGPISLTLIPIGGSGERKSTVDAAFSRGIREWQEQARREATEAIKRARAKRAVWESRKRGLDRLISGLEEGRIPQSAKAKGSAATAELIENLRKQSDYDMEQLIMNEPIVPSEPTLFFGDATIEGLVKHMEYGLPIGALWEDEAGVILGSVGLSSERLLGFLTGINKLWDGKELTQVRASVANRNSSGKRFTTNLMMQSAILNRLVGLQDGVARGSGFLARALICEPASTIGSREYSPPGPMPCLDAFVQRTKALLARDLPISERSRFCVTPPVLSLSHGAYVSWQEHYREVEAELGPLGDLFDVSDFGSKCADQAARIAGVFHVFCTDDIAEPISRETMDSAAAVALWFLFDTLRVMRARAIPQRISDATELWRWASDWDGAAFTKSDAATKGPYRLRKDKRRRDVALEELIGHGYLRAQQRGSGRLFTINPRLREGKRT